MRRQLFKAVEGKWLEGRYFVYVGRDYAYTSHTQIDPKEPNNACPIWIYILYATVVKVCIHISNTHNVIPIQHSPNENCEVPLLGLKLSSSALVFLCLYCPSVSAFHFSFPFQLSVSAFRFSFPFQLSVSSFPLALVYMH